jgi:NAD(P)H-flavin reductase
MYLSATIKWIKKETRDTSTYSLKVKGEFAFTPGQFNMLYIPGIGEAPISISSSPSEHELLHTIRIAGDVTTAISNLKAGDAILFRGPYGSGWPMAELKDRTLMIIAGGLGIAPLRSVIREVLRMKNTLTERPLLLYGSKSPKDIIFRNELSRFRDIFDLYLSVDRADPETVWRGDVGLVTKLLKKITFDPLNTVVFLCGPEIMMESTIHELLSMGVPEENIYLSMERNMNCGTGICGHCMFGPRFVCKDGPVFRYTDVMDFLGEKGL